MRLERNAGFQKCRAADRSTIIEGELTTQQSPMPGWYPDPAGTGGQAYWNGREWQPSSNPPTNNRRLIIVGSIVGGVVLLGLLSNIGSGSDSGKTTGSTVTKTVTVTVQPSAVTALPTISTVTVTPPAPFFEPPAPAPEPPVDLPPSEPEPMPPIAPLVPQLPSTAYYGSCAEARAAGAAPLRVGEPGYRSGLDRDGDGVACE
jgi:hypothetical protein